MVLPSQPNALAEVAEYVRGAKADISEEPPNVALVRLLNDARGKSHFGQIDIGTTLTDFAPPALPLYISQAVEAKRTLFLVFPVGWYGKSHPAPKRQLMVFLKGTIEVVVSDGEKRLFNPGDFCLLEDTSGEGHASRNVGAEPVVASVTQY